MSRRQTLTLAAVAILSFASALLFGGDPVHAASVLNVAPTGSDSSTCGAAATPCKTIGQAVTNAAAGDTVAVAAGVYHEGVTLAKGVTLAGTQAVIDATGHNNGVLIGKGADGATVSGFSISGATGEGILATQVANITITGNAVGGNDLGANKPGYADCQPQGPVPGDCGEAIHLSGVTNSTVSKNDVERNLGGILLTDELGPTANNTLDSNIVSNNTPDCGITLAGHNVKAFAAGQTAPTVAGIFNNTISNNTVSNNGDGGVGIFASAPGTADYANTVTGNHLSGNGMAGVALHTHAPNQYLNDNNITNNVIDKNNVVGDDDAGDHVTTGILVSSPVVPVGGTVIKGNQISNNEIGIWLTANVATAGIAGNTFTAVGTLQHVQPGASPSAQPAPPKVGNAGLVAGRAGLPVSAYWLAAIIPLLLGVRALAGKARRA